MWDHPRRRRPGSRTRHIPWALAGSNCDARTVATSGSDGCPARATACLMETFRRIPLPWVPVFAYDPAPRRQEASTECGVLYAPRTAPPIPARRPPGMHMVTRFDSEVPVSGRRPGSGPANRAALHSATNAAFRYRAEGHPPFGMAGWQTVRTRVLGTAADRVPPTTGVACTGDVETTGDDIGFRHGWWPRTASVPADT
jgi:hypothetical protein